MSWLRGISPLKISLVLIFYIIFGAIGLEFHPVEGIVALVWIPSGLALATVLLWGAQIAIPVFLGSAIISASVRLPIIDDFLIPVGLVLQVLFGAFLYDRNFKSRQMPRGLTAILKFIFYVAVPAVFVGAIFCPLVLYFSEAITIDKLPNVVLSWWLGDVVGIIFITPFILFLSEAKWEALSRERFGEFSAFLLSQVFASWIVLGTNSFVESIPFHGLYLLFPFFLWACFRFQELGAIICSLTSIAVGSWGIYNSSGAFAIADAETNLFMMQFSILFVGCSGLAIGGVVTDKNRLYKKAQRSIELRDEFLSIASHELKTPLTSLSLNLQLLDRELRPIKDSAVRQPRLELITQSLDSLRRQSKKLGVLVEELLDLSRINNDRLVLHAERMNLTQLFEEVLFRFELEAKQAGIELSLISPGPIWGNWDWMRLEQVLTNLIKNAIHHGQVGPVVTTLEPIGNNSVGKSTAKSIRITVSDHGGGVPIKDRHRIFEKYRSVKGKRRDHFGLGLGLYIARQVMEAHGGSIQLDPLWKGGAHFVLVLPHPEPMTETSETVTLEQPRNTRRENQFEGGRDANGQII